MAQAPTGFPSHHRELEKHGRVVLAFGTSLGSKHFWQQSFQNWQGAFLSVGARVVLTLFLRECGSAESKEVEAPHRHTGR